MMPFRKDLACHRLEREQDTYEVGRRVRLYDIETGAEHAIAPTGALESAELIRLIGGNFESGFLPSPVWTSSNTGSGTEDAIDGELVLETGVVADSTANIQSQDRAEFVTATFNKAHLAFQFPNHTALNVIREFGMYDPVTPASPNTVGNGVFFRNNEGVFSVVRRRGGVDVEETFEADFNGGNDFIFDEQVHVYEITYNAGNIIFLQDRKCLHVMKSLSSVAYNTVHLTLGASVRNINGNTTPNFLKSRGFACSRIGSSSSQPDSISVSLPSSGLLKAGPSVLESVIITQTGTGGAELLVYDNVAAVGTPAFSIDLTINSLFDLNFQRRMNLGVFYVVTGNNFEVVVNWR